MKKGTFQQVILLLTTSALAQQQRCKNNADSRAHRFFQKEQLQEAFWNGLELLPTILPAALVLVAAFLAVFFAACQKDLKFEYNHVFMSYSCLGTASLQLALGAFPVSLKEHFSINPDLFRL